MSSAAMANRPIFHNESDMEGFESATEFTGVLLDLPTILDKLNPIESDVILRRYGFIDGKKQSLRSLSRMFGYNLAAVIDIHRRALRKIKANSRKIHHEPVHQGRGYRASHRTRETMGGKICRHGAQIRALERVGEAWVRTRVVDIDELHPYRE